MDEFGFKAASERGIALGDVGQKLLFENQHVRVWEVRLEPGESIHFHFHYHPYLVVSLGGGENEIETIFGKKIPTDEPAGSFVFIDEMRPVHRLTNTSRITYWSRLIELKSVTWTVPDGGNRRSN
jgi:quercetin dioxygenase-like cupin family protein